MQNEITTESPLLDDNGQLVQKGWARKNLLQYNPEKIRSPKRLKEWDFYAIYCPSLNFGLNLTLADIGYFTLAGIEWFDFQTHKSISRGAIRLFTGNKTLPHSSDKGDIHFQRGKLKLDFKRTEENRILRFQYPNFVKNQNLDGEIILDQDPNNDSMVVATPYPAGSRCFYYNQKINGLPAHGTIQYGNRTFELTTENSFGHIDWGRGIWPYNSYWLWGTGYGIIDQHHIWFNIGYGFGDLTTHTENMLFVDGKVHKLDQVEFHFDPHNPEFPWHFTSNDGRFNMILNPLLVRKSNLNIGILASKAQSMHGIYSGTIVLDDGTSLQVDNLFGHAEECSWRW